MTHASSQGRPMNRPNNHQRGAALEELLNWQHNIYGGRGEALIWHNGTNARMHRGEAVLVKSQPDYSGVLTTMGGRFVSFDAKLSATPHYRHSKDRLHQLFRLWQVQEAGGISFLLISVELERFYLIWPDLAWRDQRPFSVRLDQLQPRQGLEVERGGGYGLPDWLSTIRALHSQGQGGTNNAGVARDDRRAVDRGVRRRRTRD